MDEKMKELQRHQVDLFPVAKYEWCADKSTDGMLECHWHNECEFFCMIEGTAYFSIDGIKTLVSQGDIIFIPSDRLHMAESFNGQPFRYRAVVFSAQVLCNQGDVIHQKYIMPMLEKKAGVKSLMPRNYKNDALGIFNRLFETLTFRPPIYEMTSKAFLLELLALVFSSGEEGHADEHTYSLSVDNIKNVINHIHQNFASNLTVTNLAHLARMSDGYFSRQFKLLTGKSPIDYVKWVRLTNASKQVAETNEKLISIAIETGFNNISYFTRSFRICFGISPTEYRKRYGNKPIQQPPPHSHL